MPFLQQGDSAIVSIPAAQSIRVGAFRKASASVMVPQGQPGGPLSTVTDTATTLGAFAAGATVTVMAEYGDVEYVVGATPVLTDQLFNPASVAITGGTINSSSVGATTPSTGSFTSSRFTSLLSVLTDSSGTPGNVTNNAAHGRAAFAAAGSTVVVTSSLVAATSSVFVSLGSADATLTSVRVTTAGGSFTVTGNAAATGTTLFDFFVLTN